MKNVLIIDGQGGLLGKQMVAAVKRLIPEAQITAVGTNTTKIATTAFVTTAIANALNGIAKAEEVAF